MNQYLLENLPPPKLNKVVLGVEAILILIFLIVMHDYLWGLFFVHDSTETKDIINTLWFFNVLLILFTAVYFFYKPLRTTATIVCGIWNINWIVANIFLMYPS